jgi:hypothetical protein
MKTLKKGILLAVVLLVATILVTGCFSEPEGYTPPDGMGSVRLSLDIDNPNARASFLPGTTLDTFQQFELNFLPGGTNPGTAKTEYWDNRAGTQKRSGTVSLVPGDYTLEIVAYMTYSEADPPAPSQPAATGTYEYVDDDVTYYVFTVSSGTDNQTIGVTLRAYDPNDTGNPGNGTFSWNITNGGITNLNTATMTLTRIGTAGSVGPINLMGTGTEGWINTRTVPVGYYYVDFVINAGVAPNVIIRNFRHILHIYLGQTTTVTYTFNDSVLGLVTYNVVVTIIDYEPLTPIPPEVQINGAPPTVVPEKGEVPVSIGGAAVVLSVSNAAAFTYKDLNDDDVIQIAWFYGSAPLAAMVTDGVLTINTAVGSPFATVGRYAVTVVGTTPPGTGPYDGAPFSTEIFLVVSP